MRKIITSILMLLSIDSFCQNLTIRTGEYLDLLNCNKEIHFDTTYSGAYPPILE